jgi:hypothetical protein
MERMRMLSLRFMEISFENKNHIVRLNQCGTAYELNVSRDP